MEIIERLKAPTPKFHKKALRFFAVLGAAAGAIILLPTVLPVVLPGALITWAGYVLAGATVGASVAKTVRDDGSIDLSKLSVTDLLKLRNELTSKARPLSGSEIAALAHVSKLISDAGHN